MAKGRLKPEKAKTVAELMTSPTRRDWKMGTRRVGIQSKGGGRGSKIDVQGEGGGKSRGLDGKTRASELRR